ncbi:AraC family transcriptional regulator [Paraflavitalea soli]|uniref:AraC family transcriptional regulator n=1 Tax=Paraflavitalea soli TaxID=2315862 RepID=A0A3B7MG54_9BACT|nr:AraC family transcriptional regulator [Paraflavitalea soli]AXY72577.1 AraC family transcriptional regulator [Paraflavitalea soli]
MNTAATASPARIALNCYSDKPIEGEAFVADHVFSYIISGTQDMWLGNKTWSFKAGDYRFFRRNQLARYVKRPGHDGFRSISVHIDQATLRSMREEVTISSSGHFTNDPLQLLSPNHYFSSFIDSLSPYLKNDSALNSRIIPLKVKELVCILLQTNPALGQPLFDFTAPGKIDLEAFMHEHYRYNVDLSRFAFLTGRSLSTFKRDFQKLFQVTPNRWLVQRRLQEAHYLIKDQHKKPADIYLDLGFEDLSHFSFAYKKAFGSAPTLH